MIAEPHRHPLLRPTEQGFTLVELSFVLVIIGLLVGGILVGMDMIRGATIRAQINQLHQYSAVLNVFRQKYGSVPGDISPRKAARFGLPTRSGTPGRGDGNRLLSGGGAIGVCYETGLIWRDLNQLGLIDGSFVLAEDDVITANTPPEVKQYLPEAIIGSGNVITMCGTLSSNYFQIANITRIGGCGVEMTPSIPVQDAWNLDRKMDNGMPLTGRVRARVTATPGISTANLNAEPIGAVTNACTDGNTDTPDRQYNISTEALANTPACSLRLRPY